MLESITISPHKNIKTFKIKASTEIFPKYYIVQKETIETLNNNKDYSTNLAFALSWFGLSGTSLYAIRWLHLMFNLYMHIYNNNHYYFGHNTTFKVL